MGHSCSIRRGGDQLTFGGTCTCLLYCLTLTVITIRWSITILIHFLSFQCHVGDNRFISHIDLAKIEQSSKLKFQKLEDLFQLVAGECISKFAKTKRGVDLNPGLQLKIMPQSVIDAVTRKFYFFLFHKLPFQSFNGLINSYWLTDTALEGFKWGSDKPNKEDLEVFFRKQPGEVRRKHLPQAEKDRRKAEAK